MINLVEINYIRQGERNENCNYLETTPQQRNELFKMINDCTEIFKDIEVNIVKTGLIKDEMNEDKRIREEVIDKIPILGGGKALLPSELKPEYENEKICYCSHNRGFNDTIITVFHESYHFNDPFDFKKCVELKEEIGDRMDLEGYLKYNIKANLSEYYADYKVANYLSNKSKFKDIFLKKIDKHFYFLNQKVEMCEHINKKLRIMKTTKKLIDYILHYKFSERFFRFMGIWRCFKNIGEFQIIQDDWDKYISKITKDNYIAPSLFDYLVRFLLDEPIKSLENKIWSKFKEYFTHYHGFNMNMILD